MHGVQINRHGCIKRHMQRIGICLTLERCTHILRVEREENILPTICAGTQVRLTERSADGVLIIEESDSVGFDSESVYTQSIKRQRESRSVFFCRVRRGNKDVCKVRRAIPGYVEIDGSIVQNRLVYMEVLVV